MLSFIYKSETKDSLPHWDIFTKKDGKRILLGYMMKDNGRYTFTSQSKEVPSFYCDKKSEMTVSLYQILRGKEITVKQDFGLTCVVNSNFEPCHYIGEGSVYEAGCNDKEISSNDLAKYMDNEKNQVRIFNRRMGVIFTVAICPHCLGEILTAN